jgi:hypothetical protein
MVRSRSIACRNRWFSGWLTKPDACRWRCERTTPWGRRRTGFQILLYSANPSWPRRRSVGVGKIRFGRGEAAKTALRAIAGATQQICPPVLRQTINLKERKSPVMPNRCGCLSKVSRLKKAMSRSQSVAIRCRGGRSWEQGPAQVDYGVSLRHAASIE